MAWAYLFAAGLFEIAWALGLKLSAGFTRPLPSVLTLTAMAISFFLLSLSLKSIPLGTAYAVWTGIGAAGTVLAGALFFGEPKDLARFAFIGLIIIGIAGLKLTSR